MRVLIIGAESSGKTSLCQALSQVTGFPTTIEYGRDLWEQYDGVLELEDMLDIAKTQIQLEAEALEECDIIFCDTSPLVTAFYSQEFFGEIVPKLQNLAKHKYDLIYFCARDFPYVDDGTRNGYEFGTRQELYYRENLKQEVKFIGGPIKMRVRQVLQDLGIYDETMEFRVNNLDTSGLGHGQDHSRIKTTQEDKAKAS